MSIKSFVTAAALVVAAVGAQAATNIDYDPSASTATVDSFSYFGGVGAGTLAPTGTFTFLLGTTSPWWNVDSVVVDLTGAGSGSLVVTGATFDGNSFTLSSANQWEYSSPFALAANTSHVISLAYTGVGKAVVGVTATAVPEPETYAMMLAGLGALGFMARRRKTM